MDPDPGFVDKTAALDAWSERLKMLVAKLDVNSAVLFETRPEHTAVLRSVILDIRWIASELEAALNSEHPAEPKGLKLMEDE